MIIILIFVSFSLSLPLRSECLHTRVHRYIVFSSSPNIASWYFYRDVCCPVAFHKKNKERALARRTIDRYARRRMIVINDYNPLSTFPLLIGGYSYPFLFFLSNFHSLTVDACNKNAQWYNGEWSVVIKAKDSWAESAWKIVENYFGDSRHDYACSLRTN